jgi:hypothetical protein
MTSENMKIKEENIIFILLLNEGLEVWRPVKAVEIEKDVYQIISKSETTDDEILAFNYQDLVKCRQKKFSDGIQGLVAYEKYI